MEPAGTPLTGPAAAGNSAFFLAGNEQQYFSELFSLCGGGGGGQPTPEAGPGLGLPAVGGSKVAELFRASQLPAEMLHQITDLCGAKHVGYFGRTQFYAALKLIAAAQSGLPVRIESIQNELPLPRFSALKSDSEIKYINLSEAHGAKFQSLHTTLEINCFRKSGEEKKKEEAKSPPMSPIGSHPASPSNYQRIPLGCGYGYCMLRSGLEQQHGSKNGIVRTEHIERESQDSSSNYPDDLWRVTEEQRDYYINQFKSLQPDLNSFISGSVAKNFFTKSKLPIPELSHIWELSDVDCDGALTLGEFCAAFHLVVARKNGYLLPDSLPETLLPDYLHAASHKPKGEYVLNSYSESLSYSSTSVEDTMNKGGEPPAPPPRPQKSHSRASSLDLNKIFQQNTQGKLKFRPESHMLENQDLPPGKSATASSLPTIKSHHAFPKQSSKQKKAIQTAIRKNKEANAVLVRLNSELQQQLKVRNAYASLFALVHEENVSISIKYK
uniref:RALBP1 associated Eps domain containing 2 n=1 Tax=Naja naja TaxID=35670 RepID=A0A8C6Y8M1_NAJNA